MQLMPETAREMHVRDAWSPRQNIYGGARYLRILANKYEGDLVKTLAAYNAGPEAVDRAGGVPRFQETQEYVRKVLDIYETAEEPERQGVTRWPAPGWTRRSPRVDEEFQHHLDAGEGRLSAGDAEGAKESLRKAAARMPRDGASLGLLGQACYRAGLYEEAAAAYGKLVDDNPAEVSARVNLGLAWLKAGRHADAVRQFSIALDLDPEHRKAMGYLGLALLESGDPRAARPWFEKSGSAGHAGPLRRAARRARARPPGRGPRRSRAATAQAPAPRRPRRRHAGGAGRAGGLRGAAHGPAAARGVRRRRRHPPRGGARRAGLPDSTGSSRCGARSRPTRR